MHSSVHRGWGLGAFFSDSRCCGRRFSVGFSLTESFVKTNHRVGARCRDFSLKHKFYFVKIIQVEILLNRVLLKIKMWNGFLKSIQKLNGNHSFSLLFVEACQNLIHENVNTILVNFVFHNNFKQPVIQLCYVIQS